MSPDAITSRASALGAKGWRCCSSRRSSPLVASSWLTRLHGAVPDSACALLRAVFATGGAGDSAVRHWRGGRHPRASTPTFSRPGPFHLRYARQFADRRRQPLDGMNRLYVAESGFTSTGAARRTIGFACAPSASRRCSRAAASGGRRFDGDAACADARAAPDSAWTRRRGRAISRRIAGEALVVAGERRRRARTRSRASINDALGNTGDVVVRAHAPRSARRCRIDIATARRCTARRRGRHAGRASAAIRSYAAPAAFEFAELLRGVPNSVYVGLYENETARDAQWFVPAAHYLETWGDARAYDGTLSVVQPLVQPLHGGRSLVEVLAALAGEPDADPLALLRRGLRAGAAPRPTRRPGSLRFSARRGAGTAAARGWPRRSDPAIAASRRIAASQRREQIEVIFVADARVHDGSFANNGWLQELPDPVTKLTWDNAALVSPDTAKRLGVEQRRHRRAHAGRDARCDPALDRPRPRRRLGRRSTSATAVAAPRGRARRRRRMRIACWPRCECVRCRAARRRAPMRRDRTRSRSRRRTGRWRAAIRRGARRSTHTARIREFAATPAARAPSRSTIRRQRLDSAASVGDDDRSRHVHRLQRVRRRVPGGEQHSGRRPRGRREVARDALAAHRSLSRGQRRRSARRHAADALPALRERAVRVRLPGRARPCTATTA